MGFATVSAPKQQVPELFLRVFGNMLFVVVQYPPVKSNEIKPPVLFVESNDMKLGPFK